MDRIGGYTLIEVMIFLAVSGVLFVSAVALIQGQQGRTQFSQSMRDIDSKINQYVSEVSASYFPSNQDYSCAINAAGRPVLTKLTAGTKGVGSNEDCIFLGKALQFHHEDAGNTDDTIGVYSILGKRANQVALAGGGTTSVLISNFAAANPTPTPSLVETYALPFGTKIVSAAKDNAADASAMAGFYIDLSQAGSDPDANKTASLTSYQYPSNVAINTPLYSATNTTGVTYNCITNNKSVCSGLLGSTASVPAAFTKWLLCFKSGSSNQTAQITVTSGPAGIQTKVDFVSCS
jgi:type II secretory pathway pseudopilin PulG